MRNGSVPNKMTQGGRLRFSDLWSLPERSSSPEMLTPELERADRTDFNAAANGFAIRNVLVVCSTCISRLAGNPGRAVLMPFRRHSDGGQVDDYSLRASVASL